MPLINLRELLKAGGQAAGVIGAGAAGYGEDQAAAVKEAIQQAQMARQARQDAIENSVKLAGINPDIQRALSGAKAAGETEGATPGLVNRENLLNPVKARGAAMQAEALIPVDVKKIQAETPARAAQAAATATATEPVEVKKAVDIATQTPQSATGTVLPGSEGNPPQLVVTGGKDPNHPLGSKIAIPGVTKEPTGGGAGMVRFGQGGPLGAASGLGSIKEMHAAHPNLQAFEKGLIDPNVSPTELDALDRFRQRLASDLQTHGIISAATASEAERELAKTNPALVTYGRNLKQFIVGDMNLSRGGTDERARMDAAVSGLSVPLSTMSPADRAAYIQQIWEGRQARLDGLDQAVPAVEAMLRRAAGGSTTVPDHSKMSDAEFAKAYRAGTFGKHPP